MGEFTLMLDGAEWELVPGVVLSQGIEIERLKAEIAELRKANARHEVRIKHYCEKLAEALAEGRALAQERDAALADLERLVDIVSGQE